MAKRHSSFKIGGMLFNAGASLALVFLGFWVEEVHPLVGPLAVVGSFVWIGLTTFLVLENRRDTPDV